MPVSERTLPYICEPRGSSNSLGDLLEFVANERQSLEAQMLDSGAVLLRGWRIENDGDFEHVSRALSPELRLYIEGNSPRSHTSDFVYTSTEYPAEFEISLHNELSYAHEPPPRIFFHCQVPAEVGGETPLVDCRTVLELLDPDVVDRFEQRGVSYVQNLHGGAGLGRSWQETFETEDRSDVEQYVALGGVDAQWNASGGLRTEQVRPATRVHPVTGERVWFNQADQWHPSNLDADSRNALERFLPEKDWPLNALFGDGTTIPDTDLDHIRETMWAASVQVPWRHGDVLVIDNMLVAHGRRAYAGDRSIRVAIG